METRLLVEIKKWKDEDVRFETDIVVLERTLTIHVNNTRLVSLAYLPQMEEELTLGFLLSEGIIDEQHQIAKMDFDGTDIRLEINIPAERISNFLESGEKASGCGSVLSGSKLGKPIQNSRSFSQTKIINLMKQFQAQGNLFQETGGVHSSALANDEIAFFADDIGRHNAVDKVIGMAIKGKKNLEEMMLLTSGRISSEIVKKAIRAKIPLLVSHSAPTSEAIRLGWDYGVIIVGFVRGKRCTVYTYFDKIC
jgi:FdhD protein